MRALIAALLVPVLAYAGGVNGRDIAPNSVSASARISTQASTGDALDISAGGYLRYVKESAGAPTAGDCDASGEQGRWSWDSTNKRLYHCRGAAGWEYLGSTSCTPYYGTFASRPAVGTAGCSVYTSDALTNNWLSDGSAWRPLLLGHVAGVEPKAVGGLTAVNQSTSTLTQKNGGWRYSGTNDGATISLRSYVETDSSTTAYVEASFAFVGLAGNGQGTPECGAVMRESSSGKMFTLLVTAWNSNGTSALDAYSMEVFNWTSNTARGTTTTPSDLQMPGRPFGAPVVLRIRRDATNVYAEVSVDRTNWTTLDTRVLTAVS